MRRKFIRGLAIILAVAFSISGLFVKTNTAEAATINDLNKSSAYAREAIQWMANNNIVSGDSKGNFNPLKSVSRAELVTLLVKSLEIDTSNIPSAATFSDVPTSHWAFKYVEAAYRAGVVSGIGNGKFGVNNFSTREQVTTMLMNYLSISKESILADTGLVTLEKFKDQDSMSDWAKSSIQFAVFNNIMSGTASDKFSPKSSATKEQFAVILYKFLNAKDSIMQIADDLRKPLLTFNGDILKLIKIPVIENNEVMVSLEAIKAFGAKVITDAQMNNVKINSTTNPGQNIYMQTGNKIAYIDYTGEGDPFNDPQALNSQVVLTTAPIRVENEIFVPLKAVTNALNIKMEWNQKTNLIKVEDSLTVKNPVLYNALKSTLQYKGEYKTSMKMHMNENISNEEYSIIFNMTGAINDTNATAKSNLVEKITGLPDSEYIYETIKIGNKVYSKDIETGEWSILDTEEADYEGLLYYDVEADRAETQNILDFYDKIIISNAGKVTFNGESVTKYQYTVKNEDLDQMIPQELLESGLGLADIYNKGLNFVSEIYINNQGQIVKSSSALTGGMAQEGLDIDVNLVLETELFNIGKVIEIVNPI